MADVSSSSKAPREGRKFRLPRLKLGKLNEPSERSQLSPSGVGGERQQSARSPHRNRYAERTFTPCRPSSARAAAGRPASPKSRPPPQWLNQRRQQLRTVPRDDSLLSPRRRAASSASAASASAHSTSAVYCDAYGCAAEAFAKNQLLAVEAASLLVTAQHIRESSESLRRDPKARQQRITPIFPHYLDALQICDSLFLAWLMQENALRPTQTAALVQAWKRFMKHYLEAEQRCVEAAGQQSSGEPGLRTPMRLAGYAQPYYDQVIAAKVDGLLGVEAEAEWVLNLLWKSRYLVSGTSFEELGYVFYGRTFYRLRVQCTPNCRLIIDPHTGTGYLASLRPIAKGERLTICDYQPYPCNALRAVERRWHHEYTMCECRLCVRCECVGWRDTAERTRALGEQFEEMQLRGASELDPDKLWLCATCLPDGGVCPEEKHAWAAMADARSTERIVENELVFMQLLGDHSTAQRAVTCHCVRCYIANRLLGVLFARRKQKVLAVKHLTNAYNTLRSWEQPHFLADAQVLESMLGEADRGDEPTDTWQCVLKQYARDSLLAAHANGSSGDMRAEIEKSRRHAVSRERLQQSVHTSKSAGALRRQPLHHK